MPDVSDVLRDRTADPDGYQRMMVVSALVHVGLFAVLTLAPGGLLSERSEAPTTVMTISLGGAPGPMNGGMTQIGGRPVQQVAPQEAPKRPEPIRAPAAKVPEMVLPTTNTKAAKAPPVKSAPEQARGRTPTKGAEVSRGEAIAYSGDRGQGFGLSAGGGGGSGSHLDVSDFCCPEYIGMMVDRIRTNWKSQSEVPGEVMIKYTIQRDGTITGVEVEKSSRFSVLDINAQRAVLATRQLPPLPGAFPNPTLTVHLSFQYTR